MAMDRGESGLGRQCGVMSNQNNTTAQFCGSCHQKLHNLSGIGRIE